MQVTGGELRDLRDAPDKSRQPLPEWEKLSGNRHQALNSVIKLTDLSNFAHRMDGKGKADHVFIFLEVLIVKGAFSPT
jgi:hypothetical protein